MEFEIIEPSIWIIVTRFICLLGFVTMLAGFVSFIGAKFKVSVIILITGMLTLSITGLVDNNLSKQRSEQMESSFSQKLSEEYNSASSRSLKDIRKDLAKYNEAPTVLTRDGEQTAVFVKRISEDDKKITMAFTVLDEKSLYPKTK